MAMKISAQRKVIGEFDKLSAALSEGPQNWMPGSFESAAGEIAPLAADTPLGRLARFARIDLGAPQIGDEEVVVPISWHSLEAEPLFPTFTGQLRLHRLPDRAIHLELKGRYGPPGGALGRAADSAALHGVAEATVEDFVERAAAS
jgi:hypothetical protein